MQSRINRDLSVLFALGLAIAGANFFVGERQRTQEEVRDRATLLMDVLNVTRDYTNEEVRALLAYDAAGSFHPQSVPSYAARRITSEMLARPEYSGYSLRESVLAAMNPDNLADAWEVELIRRFKASMPAGGYDLAHLPRTTTFRGEGKDEVLVVASPIVVPPPEFGCLHCHGARAAAPQGMLTAYPAAAAFGWVPGTVVGADVVTVPFALASERLRGRLLTLLLSLLAVFTLQFAALNRMLTGLLLRPLSNAAAAARRLSLGEPQEDLPEGVPGEFGVLHAAINRLRRSTAKALDLVRLGDDSQDPP